MRRQAKAQRSGSIPNLYAIPILPALFIGWLAAKYFVISEVIRLNWRDGEIASREQASATAALLELMQRFRPDAGLTDNEVRARLKRSGPNEIPDKEETALQRIVRRYARLPRQADLPGCYRSNATSTSEVVSLCTLKTKH